MVQAGLAKDLIDCIYGAKIYRPDGIIQGKETWDILNQEDLESTCNYPSKVSTINKWNAISEIVTFTAGTGIGKPVCREIVYHLTRNKQQ